MQSYTVHLTFRTKAKQAITACVQKQVEPEQFRIRNPESELVNKCEEHKQLL